MNELMELELEEIENIALDKERFKIENLESANWALRKLKALKVKEDEIKALADAEIKRINDWSKSEIKDLEDSNSFFEGLLIEYFITEKTNDSKFKLKTPYGQVSSRKQQASWNYDDEKVIEWLNENNKDLVRVKYEPSKAEIKKLYQVIGNQVVTDDGEIVEGITVEERPDTISIKVVE